MFSRKITAWAFRVSRDSRIRKLLVSRFFRRIFGTIGPKNIIFESEGCKYYCNLLEFTGVTHYLLKNGFYEKAVTKFIQEFTDPEGDVLDIGANIGYYSIICAKRTMGKVYAFEPEPNTFRRLQANIKLNKMDNIVPINCATSDYKGEIEFFVNSRNMGDHRCTKMTENLAEVIKVKADRIENILSLEEFHNVRLIKIDVQGYEYKTFKGMEEYLKKANNLKIISEFEPDMLITAGCRPIDYLKFITSLGFKMSVIDEEEIMIRPSTIKQIMQWSQRNKVLNVLFEK